MPTDRVEAEGKHGLDIRPYQRVGDSGVVSFRIESVVEDTGEVDGFAVEPDRLDFTTCRRRPYVYGGSAK